MLNITNVKDSVKCNLSLNTIRGLARISNSIYNEWNCHYHTSSGKFRVGTIHISN